jgi:hypothetical protein
MRKDLLDHASAYVTQSLCFRISELRMFSSFYSSSGVQLAARSKDFKLSSNSRIFDAPIIHVLASLYTRAQANKNWI